jgi:hypothetical protein
MGMSEDNPFEDLEDEVGDREGDPFQHLDADDRDDDTETAQSPWEDAGAETSESADVGETTSESTDATTPGSTDATTSESTDATTPDQSAASDDSTSSVDQAAETASDSISTGAESNPLTGDGTESGPEIGPPSDTSREGDPFESMEDAFTEQGVDEVDTEKVWQQLTDAQSRGSVSEKQGRTYAKVSKHSYCEQCEHFSEPPDINCSNEGTEIVEFLDMQTVRVVDCPVVAERKELEDN